MVTRLGWCDILLYFKYTARNISPQPQGHNLYLKYDGDDTTSRLFGIGKKSAFKKASIGDPVLRNRSNKCLCTKGRSGYYKKQLDAKF